MGAETVAGSIPSFCAIKGTSDPIVLAQVQIATIENPTTAATASELLQNSAQPSAIHPSSTPKSKPLPNSRTITRQVSRKRISPSARPRITVETVCAPVLPPVPIKSGMKTESTIISDSSSSNTLSTLLVKVPARNRNSSQMMRLRTERRIGTLK